MIGKDLLRDGLHDIFPAKASLFFVFMARFIVREFIFGERFLIDRRKVMGEKAELMTLDNICNHVYAIRGQQVMLDADLAQIYGYEVKRLNAQVKNNISRFPEDFMFQLTKSELENLRSNFSTANINSKSRSLPYAFTEQGIYMLATVLRGELAEQQSIFLTPAVVSDFTNQYSPFYIKPNPDCHDRLIVIDYGLPTEQVYHCGASSKDAGKKLCAINKIENNEMIHPVMDRLLLGVDKKI